MDPILQMFAFKTTQIQNNLLDLMSTLVEYEKSSTNGHQLDTTFDNKVLVNKTVFHTIQDFLPKVTKNLKTLSEIIDKNVAENERLTQELSVQRKRNSNSERQLQEVRKLYRELKDEIEWEMTCNQVFHSDLKQNCAQNKNSIESNDNLKTCLNLILNSSHNQRTVQSFMENQEVFREFMATIHSIFEAQIKAHPSDSFDPNLFETICGICVNVFQSNDYSGEDIPQWIDSLTAIQTDKRLLKSSINALHFICFAPNGTEELQKKSGIITLLAKCLIDSELKHEFKLKTNVVKMIRRMIDNSKDTEIGIKLFNEFIVLIPIQKLREMIDKEQYIQLKKAMSLLLTTFLLFTNAITED